IEFRRNVHVFSHVAGGTINGFGQDIFIVDSSNVKVKQLLVTGPFEPVPTAHGDASGVFVEDSDCGVGNVEIGGGVSTGNEISYDSNGIELIDASCAYVGHNEVHDNGDAGGSNESGIFIVGLFRFAIRNHF